MNARSASVSKRVTLLCACGARTPCAFDERAPAPLSCSGCGTTTEAHAESLREGGGLAGCVACGHPELFRAKRFPRALGIAIVVVAAVLAPWTSYVSLAVAALLDLALYALLSDVVVCYVCRAEHAGFAPTPRHPRFDRTIEERLRYGARAVMGSAMRPGGTAGAPEPDH